MKKLICSIVLIVGLFLLGACNDNISYTEHISFKVVLRIDYQNGEIKDTLINGICNYFNKPNVTINYNKGILVVHSESEAGFAFKASGVRSARILSYQEFYE
jgi:hypothetical protein